METTITVNLSEGSFYISGSEDFVEKNKEDLKDFISQNLQYKKENSASDNNDNYASNFNQVSTSNNQKNKYIEGGIYSIDQEDGSVHILKRIPGKNTSEKAKNIALIVLFAKGDGEKIKGSEIKGLCEKQKCYDAKNFAATFKRDMSNFVMKGKGQNWTLELSIPGKENAVNLLENMCNNE